ncbi:Serine/threonine-protein kinase [Neonectria magnoliae]|uniref:Serine/threonine-protein kinase n=1 Tax=Neonectria magnoliae TaxID=2732573 RepID=A0ABR1IKE6_9HYPO
MAESFLFDTVINSHLFQHNKQAGQESYRAVSESLSQAPVVKTPKPGILIVTLHEARGLPLPENIKTSSGRGFKEIPTVHGRVSGKYMPYALVDFDKAEVFVNSSNGTPENPLWAENQYKFDVLRVSELTAHFFIPNPNAAPGSGRTQDIFLGVTRLNPRLEPIKDSGKGGKSSKDTQRGLNDAGWLDLHHGEGKLRISVQYAENQAGKLTVDDFELLTVVGKGSFGKVYQVRRRDTNCIYALKSIQKTKIISRTEVTHTLAERSILAQINSPFIVNALDADNIGREFTSEAPEDSYVDHPDLSQIMQDQFAGFSYNGPVAGLNDAGGSIKDPSIMGGL